MYVLLTFFLLVIVVLIIFNVSQQRRVSSSMSFKEQDILDNNDERNEIQEVGAVKASVYKSYFKAVDSFLYISLVAVMFIVAQGLISAVDFYISQW